MNRFKKELRKKGFKFESDYPWLPYYVKGDFGKPGNICLEGIFVNSEYATVVELYNVGEYLYEIQRNGKVVVK